MKFIKFLIGLCPRILPYTPKRLQLKIAGSLGLDLDGDLMTIKARKKQYTFYYNIYEGGFKFCRIGIDMGSGESISGVVSK